MSTVLLETCGDSRKSPETAHRRVISKIPDIVAKDTYSDVPKILKMESGRFSKNGSERRVILPCK